jgi:multidrug efflux system outer membrane protein
VIASVVAQVATAYFQIRELDSELEITRRALSTREASLSLTQVRESGGVASMVDVYQAESLVVSARASIPQILQQIEQLEDLISVLLGENPRSVTRQTGAFNGNEIPVIPPGLPSSLLDRRPDIREAEQTLMAANAQIGVARATLFPNVALTAYGGVESAALRNLFNTASRIWGVSPGVTAPIFAGGRLRAGVRIAESQQRAAAFSYSATIQQAFREVSDALFAHQRTTEFRREQEALVTTYANAAQLSETRYRGGVTTYLEVLDSERNVYGAEITLARARLNEVSSVIQLYLALGGGWQE